MERRLGAAAAGEGEDDGAGHGGEGWGQRGGTDSVCLCAPRWGARVGVVGEGGMGAGLPGTGDPPDISLPGPVGL